MESKEALVALNMIPHVGPVRLRKLLEHFENPAKILTASRAQLTRIPGVGADTADAILQWESSVDLAAEWRRIQDFQCRILTQTDEEYPESLGHIYDPPIVLYARGQLRPSDKNAVALVGTRLATSYGAEAARKLGYQLAYLGVTVVSGGARGIDTAAHQGALAAKGRTVAVLGTGLDLVFPPENKKLFDRIAEQGAVLSQYPFGRRGDKQSFAIRNRIVAGMCLGTVVVEANLASGALITANFANDYGRQVFAVPGRIDSPRSKGCHDLIKKGAKLCESPEDILSEFEYLFPKTAPAGDAPRPAGRLTESEQRVLDVMSPMEEAHMDQIIRLSGLSSATVAVALLSLEMKQLVRQMPGKRFVDQSNRNT